ncbi:MAG: L-seryl-tRNA(Sec) selenium transferase [Myxococcales bacterium FL481]|nr:MAG: L-seryl-tRNA(Sec) selenium transferase [Myxococcales bacterium FL481]
MSSLFAQLPKVDNVLDRTALQDAAWSRDLAKSAVQAALTQLRLEIKAGTRDQVPSAEALADGVRATLVRWTTPHPRRVINATGVLLHTNLGRAPLAVAAVEAMAAAAGVCDLEIDLASGTRGSRFAVLRPFMSALLGAPDVHVVNNGAAALLLACTALGKGGAVAISRGQLVEIGDGFRIAEMAATGGVRLLEVGSTNRTHLRDYERVLDPAQTDTPVQALLWAHQSNFVQSGFVGQVDLSELSQLAERFGAPLIADLGSGSLGGGLPAHEPTIQAYLAQGADLVTCSGDKLLCGPQAGIMAGDAELVNRCRRHPMARALRPDKTTLAALHATLALHAAEGEVPALPLHRMHAASGEQLRQRAAALCDQLGWEHTRILDTKATIGGGSLPGDTMPSVAVVVARERPNQVAKRMRLGIPPVVGRVVDDAFVVDLRSVLPEEDPALVSALVGLR